MTAPTPPVDLATLRSFLNLSSADSSEDDELAAMLTAATEQVESVVGPMVAVSITDKVYGRNGMIVLRAPVLSVESISLLGSDSFDLTMLDIDLKSGVVSNPYGYALGYWWWSMPGASPMPFDVAYTAGWGTTADDVPQSLKQATMLVAEQLWKTQRGPVTNRLAGGSTEQVWMGFLWPKRAVDLLAPFVQYAFA